MNVSSILVEKPIPKRPLGSTGEMVSLSKYNTKLPLFDNCTCTRVEVVGMVCYMYGDFKGKRKKRREEFAEKLVWRC